MVSADNLHLDVLQLIFDHVDERDIASLPLVSRSFFDAAVPRLYRKIVFKDSHARKYQKTVSPFAVLRKRPNATVHVQSCYINALPLYKGQPHHEFLVDCKKALELCNNLTDFRLAVNIMPIFIDVLQPKARLRTLAFNGSLTEPQVKNLTLLSGNLETLHIVHGSWCMMNAFPSWMRRMGPTLTQLSITLCPELNIDILEESLKALPNLLGLRVTNCMRIEHQNVFRVIRRTPLLESLTVTAWEHPSTDPSGYALIPSLRHLHIDTRNTISTMSLIHLWDGIIKHTRRSKAPIESLIFQLSEQVYIDSRLIDDIMEAHADTLTTFRLKNCAISTDILEKMCGQCTKLEVVSLPINTRSVDTLAVALEPCKRIHTVIDEREKIIPEHPMPPLRFDDVQLLMERLPSLKTVESESKRWTAQRGPGTLSIILERIKPGAMQPIHRFTT